MEQKLQDDEDFFGESLEKIPFSTQMEEQMNQGDPYIDVLVRDMEFEKDEENFIKHLGDVMIDEDQDNIHKVDDDALALVENKSLEVLNIDMTSLFQTDREFTTHEDVFSHLKSLGRTLGIVIVKKISDLTGKRTPFILFQCEKGGTQRDHCKGGHYHKKQDLVGKNKSRDSSSRKCGCPFQIKSSMDRLKLTWSVQVLNGVHNHRVVKFDEGHSYLGRLDAEAVDVIARMTANGILPKYILQEMRSKDPKNCTQLKAIYNIRARLRLKEREGRTVMQEVFHLADKSRSFIHCREEDNVVKDIFWAHADSLSLARCFPFVMLMDCTYKTNRYKMPLLQIVGITSTKMSFCVGFALLCFEKEDNYTWALHMLRKALGDKSECVRSIVTDREEALMKAIHVVFPSSMNLLCRWHIEKGLVSNLKTKTTSQDWSEIMMTWNELVRSKTETELSERLVELKTVFNEDAVKYVTKTWLDPHKERFITAWTDNVFHLGNTSTSRVEGMHSTFKNWLNTGGGDMVRGWEAGVKMVEQEIRNIKNSFEKCLFMVPKKFKDEKLFKDLVHCVSFDALELLAIEVKQIKEVCVVENDCGCSIKKIHGLPCFHEITMFEKNPGYIPLSSIHVHWKTLDIEGPPPTDSQLDHMSIMHALEERMNTVTVWEKQKLLVKLREICQPSITILEEPIIKLKGRGRPKGSGNKRKVVDDESTKRELSLHEHVDGAIKQCHETSKQKKLKQKARISPQVSRPPIMSSECTYMRRYMKYIPEEMHAHVSSIVNVAPDGNCGFRVIANAIGLSEDGWPTVRRMIREEMVEKKDHYLTLLKHGEVYESCLSTLDHYKGSCGSDKYFDSFVGWAVCNVFDVVFSIVSTKFASSQTFLPTLKAPTKWPPLHIWTIHCNGNHFLHAKMKDSCSILGVNTVWHVVRSSEASQWHSRLHHRFMHD